jgi:hypothetical protein
MAKTPKYQNNLLDRIRINMDKLGLPNRSQEATTWLFDKTKKLKIGTNQIMKDNWDAKLSRLVGLPQVGKMYHFSYDAKYKDTLPYFDRFPLIIMVKPLQDGFFGLNLHYLSPTNRIGLLGNLESIANNNKWDDTTKLRISYDVLVGSAKFADFRPCFKRYLTNHVQTSFLYIPPSEWEIACLIPSQRFVNNKNISISAKKHVWS